MLQEEDEFVIQTSGPLPQEIEMLSCRDKAKLDQGPIVENMDLWASISVGNEECSPEAVETQKTLGQQNQSWVMPEVQSCKPKRLSALDSVIENGVQDTVQHLRRVHVTLQQEHDHLRKRLGLNLGAVVEVSAVVSGPEKDLSFAEPAGPEVAQEKTFSPSGSTNASANGAATKRASILLPPTSSLQSSNQPRRTSGKEKMRVSTDNADRSSIRSDGSFVPKRISEKEVKHRMSLMLTGPEGEGFAPVLPHQLDTESEGVCSYSASEIEDPTHSRCSEFSVGSHRQSQHRKSYHSNRTSVETEGVLFETSKSIISNRSVRSMLSATSRKSYKNLCGKALEAYACWTSDCDEDLHRRIRLFQGCEELDQKKRFSGNSFQIRNSITGGRQSIRSMLEGITASMPIMKIHSSGPHSRRESVGTTIRKIAAGEGSAVDPSSPARMFWNVVSIALLIYDLVFIPLQIFDMPITNFSTVMRWFSVVFWMLDIFASFWVGFLREGVAELRLRQVRWRYLRTWFAFDVILWVADVANTVMAGKTDAKDAGGSETSSTIRDILGALQLLRMLKLPKLAAQMHVHVQSQLSMVVLGIAKMMAMILALNHVIACVWYGISRWNEGQDTWLRQKSDELRGSSVLYFYTLSLHWSLTQFTPATMEVHPENVSERVFAIVVIYFALITFSSFVSSITNAMTHLRHMNKEKHMQFEQLQRYFHGNHISSSLRVRVRRHLDHLLAQRDQFVNEKDVTFLQLLSGPLRVELRYEVFAPVLRVHGFFQRYEDLFLGSMQKICYTAVDQLCLSLGDKLFTMGEKGSKMYFIRSGMLEYRHHGGKTALVSEGQWLAEVPLWCPWIHAGTATAIDESTLVTLDAAKFQDAVVHNKAALLGPSHYACLVVEYLNSCERAELSDVMDPDFNLERALLVAFADLWETDSRISEQSAGSELL